jgi:hypothetical protein
MTLEDITDCLITERISQVGQGTNNAVIAPRAVFLCVDGVTSSNFNQRTGKMAQIEN